MRCVYYYFVVVVLFNFLVICFKLNDLDNDHVIAWHLLEPFWLIEVFLFKAALFIVAGYFIFLAIQLLYSYSKRVKANYGKVNNNIILDFIGVMIKLLLV